VNAATAGTSLLAVQGETERHGAAD
jgi:hypothetical protein